MTEAPRVNSVENRRFCSNGVSLTYNFTYRGGRSHRPFFVSENYDERAFMWCKKLGRTLFRFIAKHAFDDGQTDRQHSHG